MDSNKYESHYSNKVRAGRRRTYFFDVRKTKGDDYYITLTESTRKYDDGGYQRHKIFLYKEDFNRFLAGLTDVIDHVKTELMPDYDYDEFDRREEEDRGDFKSNDRHRKKRPFDSDSSSESDEDEIDW